MTAERWWVRLAARWMARIEAVKGIVDMVMLLMTGISTTLIGLKSYGYGQYALPLIVGVGAGTVVFTYLYTEGGVWNQKNRDSVDMSTNFAGPTMRIDDELTARGILAAQKGRPLKDAERRAIQQELDEAFVEYRDGYEIVET